MDVDLRERDGDAVLLVRLLHRLLRVRQHIPVVGACRPRTQVDRDGGIVERGDRHDRCGLGENAGELLERVERDLDRLADVGVVRDGDLRVDAACAERGEVRDGAAPHHLVRHHDLLVVGRREYRRHHVKLENGPFDSTRNDIIPNLERLVEVKAKIESLYSIAPLHNPANLEGILSMEKVLPGIKQVAVFDTSFHHTIPAINYMYAIPYEYYEKYRVRKYGFHGTSHKFVARVGAEMFGLDFENSKIVTCHIGNGASVTAVLNGKSFDTSMGFTPLDGLVMGTRAGSMDVSAATYVAEKEGMSYKELDTMLNKQSGVQGLTGISSDMRDIDAAYDKGNERAIMARDMYFNRVKKFVGEYAAEMGGLDLVVFTGGVGENSPELREYVLRNMEFMGIEFDEVRNNGKRGTDYEITKEGSRVKAAVICTDEELVIAKDTYRLTK